MSIEILEVKNKSDLKSFIYLPEKIHRNHANWVHPIYLDEKQFFNFDKNEAFRHNRTALFLARENGRVVGRIMAIIPDEYNNMKNVRTARFCYFEAPENKRIFDALLNKVEQWAKDAGCNLMVGPMGFSDKEPQGFLTAGYNEKTMIVTNCSFRYMKEFLEARDYSPFVELCQYDVPLSNQIIQRYRALADRVESNMRVTVHEFTKTSEIKPFVQSVFRLINTTYTDIYGFTKVTEKEAEDFANRFIPLLNPRLIKLITDESGEVVAFVIGMPDLSGAIKKSRGRIFPFGWFHILRAFRNSKRMVLLLGAVKNEMQNKGLDAVLAVRLIRSALDLGFDIMDSHLIMRKNIKMRREIERLENHRMYKEYTIYSKEL
ncbi:MAG: GNAT family N-acetyltransferase [Saprospiraceae bacterium]|nr:GNAT family N-acetyltransferase [Saprospiraceae bacterium]MBX7179361.1 GNAT family N-acetyltransferase [Saprospiraceae bacterium]MCB0591011.1 GNAT family N-acetyltransferase [Saprospiraceae bacterium]MCC7150074.1 GNAT family N-acetyltransferase [Saprospiraceae bacterium]MCO5282944.1 GNAT family N-acetyltransferase [Saprospiraceae bacterium]